MCRPRLDFKKGKTTVFQILFLGQKYPSKSFTSFKINMAVNNTEPEWPSTVSRCRTRGESEDHTSEKAHKGSTLALKPRADGTRSPKQGYQCSHEKNLKKNKTKQNKKRAVKVEDKYENSNSNICLFLFDPILFIVTQALRRLCYPPL